MNKKTYYSRNFKRYTLIEIANGKNFEEILRSSGFDVDNAISKDKKYCSKLLHKWKNEVYKNNEIMYFSNNKITKKAIEYELLISDDKNEDDIFISEYKDKILQGKHKYKKLKNYVLSAYKK